MTAQPGPGPARPLYAYVGSRTTRERHARGEGITVYRVDDDSGDLAHVQTVAELVNPSFLAVNAAGDRIYTVHGDGHAVSVLARDAATGLLALLQTQDCGGRNPVHLAIDPTGRHLVVSDHLGQGGGTLAVLPIAANGCLGAVQQRVPLPGAPGPHRTEQPFAKPHFNPFDPSGRFVLVPDKGLDRVFVFSFADGCLRPTDPPWMPCREGAGPRHVAFHPTQPWAYVINELDSTVAACRFDAASGALAAFQIVPTLADTFVGNSRAAEIEVARDGRHVYVSNRGADTVATLAVEPGSGRLAWRGAVDSGGRTPRFFACSPDGRSMYVLNEDSDRIARFALQADGMPSPQPRSSTPCGSPVCMVFAPAA